VVAEEAADPATVVVVAGWIGQACFFLRFFVQWLASEKARASVVPRSFWWLSLAGSVLVAGYALDKGEYVLLVSLVIGGVISARNLALRPARARAESAGILVLAILMIGALVAAEIATNERFLGASPAWAAVGLLGQALWVARFPLQWWMSEREGESRFPAAFWWTSLAGNLLLLAYAIELRDLLFVLAYLPGPILQARNLMLGRRSGQPAS
jgi:lipid-A-disaccharide synthase-like uncharacterized protein